MKASLTPENINSTFKSILDHQIGPNTGDISLIMTIKYYMEHFVSIVIKRGRPITGINKSKWKLNFYRFRHLFLNYAFAKKSVVNSAK